MYYLNVCFKNFGLNISASWRLPFLSFFILTDGESVFKSSSSGPSIINNSSKCSFHLSLCPDLVPSQFPRMSAIFLCQAIQCALFSFDCCFCFLGDAVHRVSLQ